MYAWLRHRLPGRTPARAEVLILILLAASAALWFFVFPWASIHLPIDTSGFNSLDLRIRCSRRPLRWGSRWQSSRRWTRARSETRRSARRW